MELKVWFEEVKDIFGHMLGLSKEEADCLDIEHWKQYYGFLEPIEAVKKEINITLNLMELSEEGKKKSIINADTFTHKDHIQTTRAN